ncbi:MAG: hypothetical protein Q9190_005744 [Brigantiaea leucoxantha]
MASHTHSWEELAKAKRESITASIPAEWQIEAIPSTEQQRDVAGKYLWQYLSEREIEITESEATRIIEKTSEGTWTAEEVTRAFCHRASLAHQIVACLHETFFDAAIEDAKSLDVYLAEHKKPKGPLHGLPISLKDQFHIKNVETTMGYVGWIDTFQGKKGTGMEKVYESEMVKELRTMGAVLYCKTSVPHTLMSGETVNNIIGYTWNPKNRNLSSGGSSGGEGALIGLRGSPVGFGTDIGGSIRIPAAFNGLYGLRPSAGRLPYEGMANSMDGQNSVLSVVGPLSHSISSLRLLVRSLLQQEPWLHDPLVHDIPWREDRASVPKNTKLAFGVLKHDETVTPHPPVQRAIQMVVKAIEKQGHKVLEWKPPSHARGMDLILKAWRYDGGADIHAAFALSGEPMAPQVSRIYGSRVEKEQSASSIAANNVAKRVYQKEYLDYWNSTKQLTGTGNPVDAVIAPIAPFAAARPQMYGYYGYSSIINLLDYTSCTLPVTTVDKRVDLVDDGFQPLSEMDKDVAGGYDPEIYDGAHVSLQIIGRRLQEENVLALTELLADALKS